MTEQEKKLSEIIKELVLDVQTSHYFKLITIDSFSENYAKEIIKAFPQITKKPIRVKRERHFTSLGGKVHQYYEANFIPYICDEEEELEKFIETHYVEVV